MFYYHQMELLKYVILEAVKLLMTKEKILLILYLDITELLSLFYVLQNIQYKSTFGLLVVY
jgi:hypothetical protein